MKNENEKLSVVVDALYAILHDLTKFTKFLLHENRRLRKELNEE